MQNYKRIVFFILSLLCAVARSTTTTDNYYQVSNYQDPPRVVSDLEIIYGRYGVKVNLQYYNETTSPNATHLGSVPGCPQSIDGFPWIYYGNPPRCFLAEHNGPCPQFQKLFIQRGSPQGICACECLANEESKKEMGNPEIQYVFCKGRGNESPVHGQLYDKKNKECYNLFETGPCSAGEVITKYTNHSITCQPLCHLLKTGEAHYKAGKCSYEPLVSYGAAAGVLAGDCRSGERYSETLRKCVRSLQLNI